ncbi:MAG TPA: glucose-6-phosphate dehydrogenase assembly protein OpcA [Gaiellales bacterium]|jgi:glucose-6-phosphate dehydrogenase assembly protein OpcA|nr:glucose-6-phosphate dehydrogenase assembly protein OpcA [Gaiellales bacterium]
MSAAVEATDLAGVEAMLRASRSGDRVGSVRAITLNLVVHAPGPDQVATALDALEHIGPSHPLRAIVTTPAGGGLRATVATSCWIGSADRQVCSERVMVEAEPEALPSAVMALLVPDLPVFVWWQGPLEPRSLVGDIADLANRLILDSGECGMDGVAGAMSLSPSLTDLAWAALLPWRDAVAALFDGRAGAAALGRLRAVDVRGPENDARLMAGWLRSRLGTELALERSGRPHRLERVALMSGNDVFRVERARRSEVGTAVGPALPEHTVVLPTPKRATLVAGELSRLRRDRVFEQALAAA